MPALSEKLSSTAYLRLLEPWSHAAAAYFYRPPDRPDLLVFGAGYNGWGVQTQQKALAALAVMATDPELDEARAGNREVLSTQALAMLRFTLESHLEGGYHCMDGARWGHTWISALGVERMMHGVEALEPLMSEDDHALLRKVLLSESEWLLDSYPVGAGPVQNNKPESNLWNGALLHRTAMMYPDAPRAAELREKGTRFLVNSISVATDAASDRQYDGRPVSAWFAGDNFFPTFALNHHGYLNVGYMVICLSNLAMLHFAYRTRGLAAPAALYHHAEELWALIKACLLPDGRLLRIGGDSRARYCYCQDYAIPMWLLAAEYFDDPHAAAFEAGWLQQVKHETTENNDGSFLSTRCAELAAVSPLYYTRLEADRAVTLSMGAYWRRKLELPAEIVPPPPSRFAWQDEYHGAVYHRSPRRVASWVWRAAELPQGLCLPADGSDLAEWRENLAGRVLGEGGINTREVTEHEERSFDGGFLTWGHVTCQTSKLVAEGQPDEETAGVRLVAAALPDDATMLVLQYACAPARRVYLTRVAGINLQVPNDLFNEYRRTYHTENGPLVIAGFGSAAEVIATGSRWLNVDDRLGIIGVYGLDELCLHRPGTRQIGFKSWPWHDVRQAGGTLYADEIVAPWRNELHSVDAESVLFDVGVVVHAGVMHDETARICREGAVAISMQEAGVRAVSVTGLDGRRYLLAANFAEILATPRLGDGMLIDLATGEKDAATAVPLAAKSARVFLVVE